MAEKTVKDTGEFGCIRKITHGFINRPEWVKLGSGDDCAVYTVPDGMDELISTDTMVEGIHFTAETMGPCDVGFKLCTSNFSDVAAMGGRPCGFVISAGLPENLPLAWLEACYDGIREACRRYGVNLLGGDITGSPGGIILTGTVTGMVPADTAVKRSGARAGDLVCVTGHPGDSGAGLEVIFHKEERKFPRLAEKHRRPKPNPELAWKLRELGASAMDDISDGLSSELNEISHASHVNIVVDGEKIPVSEETIRFSQLIHQDILHFPLTGGEDYELVFTIPRSAAHRLQTFPEVHIIGYVEEGNGVVQLKQMDTMHILKPEGYHHFEK